jgi:hypothetical protein
MSTTGPGVMTEKNHTQKHIHKNVSTDVDVSDYGESKSAIKKNRTKKKTLKPLSGRENFFFYHIYIYIYTNIYYISMRHCTQVEGQPKRLELLFRTVLAFPKACTGGRRDKKGGERAGKKAGEKSRENAGNG